MDVIALYIDSCPVVYNGEPAPAIMSGITVPGASTVTVTVPLFKGSCVWLTDNWAESYTVSGNIEDNEEGYIMITGDGTVTLTGLV